MAEVVRTARVFVRNVLLTDTQCDAVKDSSQIPTSEWEQLYSKGDVTISAGREIIEVGNDQIGTTALYIANQPVEITLPLSEDSFNILLKYAQIDPTWSSGDTTFDYKDNRGVELSGFSLLIYDKNEDPTNETNTPDVTADSRTHIFFEVVNKAGTDIHYNSDQGIVTLTLTALANNSSSGNAKGLKGMCGTFTAA